MKKFIILSVISFLFVIKINAQETIDLNKAINIALEKNATVNNLERSFEIQRLTTGTARGNLFPSLSLSGSWNRNNVFSEGTIRFENGAPIPIAKQNTWTNSFSLGLNSQVTLFNGFSNYQQVELEKQNENSVRINLNKEKYDVVYRVNTSFFDVLKKGKIVEANEENLTDSKAQLVRVKEFMNVGKKTLADVYRQDVQVAQDELTLERSKNEFAKSKVDLLLAMNADINKEYVVSDQNINIDLTDSDIQAILDRNSNTEALLQNALQKRFDYKSSIQDVKTSRMQYEIDTKNLYFPTVSGFANYNLNASKIENIKDSRTFTFGLSVSYPIFQGMRLNNKSQISEIIIKQKEENTGQLAQQIRSEIKKAYLDLETQNKQIEILNRNIVSAQQDKILSEENYRVGLGTLLDAQTAATKLNSLKIDLINAKYDFLLAERRLRYYSGDLSY